MTFAELLKKLRAKAGLSQSGLARDSSLSLGAIHDYEQGKREPSMRSAFRLASGLGVSVEAFAACLDDDSQDAAETAPKASTRTSGGQSRQQKSLGKAKRSAGEGKAKRSGSRRGLKGD